MRNPMICRAALVFLVASQLAVPALADDKADEQAIQDQQDQTDAQADSNDRRKQVETRLKDQYSVDDATIAGLREKKMGYGEIDTTLALASRMEGGITPENIQKITDMRTGANKTGWGKIAKQFDVKVGELK